MTDPGFILPSGTTDLYIILGDPIAQVQAPIIFNDIFRRSQRDAVMVALKVSAANLARTFAGLKHIENLRGISLAIPHKGPMLALADDVSAMANIVGATNAVRRNPDGRWPAVPDSADQPGAHRHHEPPHCQCRYRRGNHG